jgi:hypothetical protein
VLEVFGLPRSKPEHPQRGLGLEDP